MPNNGLPSINALLVQPNGLVLVAGTAPNFLVRLRPDGSSDPTFTNPGIDNVINSMAITPTGQIVAGGYFLNAGGQRRMGLVRLTAGNVLHVAANQFLELATAAYPNPARAELHLALDMAARPTRAVLLDAVGRVVLQQSVAQPNPVLSTIALVPGCYVLRVDYATGPVTRRIVIE